jgi:hypothetical protein
MSAIPLVFALIPIPIGAGLVDLDQRVVDLGQALDHPHQFCRTGF